MVNGGFHRRIHRYPDLHRPVFSLEILERLKGSSLTISRKTLALIQQFVKASEMDLVSGVLDPSEVEDEKRPTTRWGRFIDWVF